MEAVAGFVEAATGAPAQFPTRIRVFGSYRTANLPTEDLPTIPQIVVRADHASVLQQLLADGEVPTVEFNIENRFRPGGATLYNVVGELRGSEKPDEVVIVGGHLDSWHQATGTTDNGTGLVRTFISEIYRGYVGDIYGVYLGHTSGPLFRG